MAALCPTAQPNTYNPFTANGVRIRGQDWNLPPASALQVNMTQGPKIGYGCFQCIDYPLGTPMLPPNATAKSALTVDQLCPRGFFCPYLDAANAVTWPVYCPPLPECLLTRLGTYDRCAYPQGIYEATPCPGGFYCPSFNEVIVCPAGSFCLTGSVAPAPCLFLSHCPSGSQQEKHFGFLVLVGIADLVIVAVFLVVRRREVKASGEPASALIPLALRKLAADWNERVGRKRPNALAPAAPPQPSVALNVANHSATDAIAHEISTLTAGFRKGLEGHDDLRMNYRFEELSLRLATGKTILQGVSGDIQSGRMTAIMGPSGAGKTTFMNVLMGKVSRTDGSLKINNVTAEMQTYRKIIGYVPQDDIMLPELTVRENLLYSARVRLPGSWSNKDVAEHVDALLKALNLSLVANSRVGSSLERGISGGQKKRVNIGLELAAAPLSVFLDEPTSGLDSTAALDVVNILRSISRLGLTIVAVIHQPRLEIFESFDDVLMVAPGGKTAYIGPVEGVQRYFAGLGFVFDARLNPADVLMDILSGRGELAVDVAPETQSVSFLVEHWAKRAQEAKSTGLKPSGIPAEVDNTSDTEGDKKAIDAMGHINALRGASFPKQVFLAHNRSMVQQTRLIGALVLESFLGALAGFMMGLAVGDGETYQGILKGQFAAVSGAQDAVFLGMTGMLNGIAIALIGAPPAVKVFGEEKEIYFREAAAGHSKLAYFIGKNISVVYRIALAAAHFASVYYFMAHPPIYLGYQYAAMFLNFFGIYGMAQIISMFIRRENAPLMAVTVGMIFGVLNGFAPTITKATNQGFVFLFDIGVNRYASEVLYGIWIQRYSDVYDLSIATEMFGYELDKTARNLGAMVGIGIAYRVVAFILLTSLNRDKQK